MAAVSFFLLLSLQICLLLGFSSAEDPYASYNFVVSYITASPLGVPQQVIAINGKFPGPTINITTNYNLVINVKNKLDENLLIHWTSTEDDDLALDRATYNWPCENTGLGKYIPTLSRVCPCALLMVMAKHNLIGNWCLLKGTGHLRLSFASSDILGMSTYLPLWSPDAIVAPIILFPRSLMTILVPLHMPSVSFRFLIIMIGQFNFNLK